MIVKLSILGERKENMLNVYHTNSDQLRERLCFSFSPWKALIYISRVGKVKKQEHHNVDPTHFAALNFLVVTFQSLN